MLDLLMKSLKGASIEEVGKLPREVCLAICDKIKSSCENLIRDIGEEKTRLIIRYHPHLAYTYALENSQKRFEEAEPEILKNRDLAYAYAVYFIKGRWPEAEPIFLTHPMYAYLYAKYILKKRWPEAEPLILQSGSSENILRYATEVIKGRWPEAEPILEKFNDTNEFAYYSFTSNLL